MGTFLNAVKNLINSLTAKTSSTASTADMVQLHDANGNPNGKISLADLASVLGGFSESIPSNSDLNNYISCGFFHAGSASIANTTSNKPSEVNASFELLVMPYGNINRVQFLWSRSGDTFRVYTRSGYTSGWSTWREITN